MDPANLVLFMADQHSAKMLGCYGHPLVQTPNLDRLAAGGLRFANAYTNSPLCVPARASLATGRHVHETGCWDNAIAYDGTLPGWGHRLQEAGIENVSIGKLHYRFATDPVGIDEQIVPMHIADGKGDVLGSVRPDLPVRHQSRKFAEQVGPGETAYTRYDRDIADRACRWLTGRAKNPAPKPWVLLVSFIAPHFPLIVPAEYFDLYPLAAIPPIKPADPAYMGAHPWWRAFTESYIFDQFFRDDAHRRMAIAAYLGLCTFVDHNIGRVLTALDECGLVGRTRVGYISDHGDNMGARGLWGKSTLHEESAGVPMILAGPGVPEGRVVSTPVSLIDMHPTILRGAGVAAHPDDADLPGQSLFAIADGVDDPERSVLAQYHGAGSISGAFMLRRGRYKYIHYTGYPPELFDLEDDPEELHNLSDGPLLAKFEARLRAMLDPEAIDAKAKRDQARLIEAEGGRAAVLKRGGLHGTPVPRQAAEIIPQES